MNSWGVGWKMKYVYILSDSVGETAERVVTAVTGQFTSSEFITKKFAYASDPLTISEIIKNASRDEAIVVFTTVVEEVRRIVITNCKDRMVPYVDVMGLPMEAFSKFLNEDPVRKPGIIHRLDENYFERVKAVEFAVKYDDGKDPRGIRLADVVLLGISRTSKTPLSMYLAHKGIKATNIPLVPEVGIPRELYNINPDKIVGLKTSARVLLRIREQRAKSMGLTEDSSYASISRINKELEYAEKVISDLKCRSIDVSDKAIEETAGIVIQMLNENKGAGKKE